MSCKLSSALLLHFQHHGHPSRSAHQVDVAYIDASEKDSPDATVPTTWLRLEMAWEKDNVETCLKNME